MYISNEAIRNEKGRIWKYVRVAGEYRFLDIEKDPLNVPDHKDVVDIDEVAESAGSFVIKKDCWSMLDGYSMTLKIGEGPHDGKCISHLLGKPFRSKYE